MDVVKNVELNDLIDEITSFTQNELKTNDTCMKIMTVSYKRISNDKIISILFDFLKYKVHFSCSEFINSKLYDDEKILFNQNKSYIIEILNDTMKHVIIEWVFVGYENYHA